ncbi:MFS transporter [Brachybacterium hainanense]|uniref:MFS transporter n=1 Tax=Brachybacterium hainanense TaxID=1541174 RepID=A0ABV6RG77_9MICO
MTARLGGPPRQESALRLVLRTPFYRGATLTMLLFGIGAAAAAPQIAMFLVEELHATYAIAGLYYLTNLTAPVAGYLIGARSDRTGLRLGLFRLCAVLGFLGWVGIAASTQLWMPFVLSAVLLGFAGAAGSQLFAALHDDLAERPARTAESVLAIVRMGLTGGWIIGPVLGALLATQLGLRALLLVTAACTLAQLLPLAGRRESAAATRIARADAVLAEAERAVLPRPGLREMAPLLAFTALYVCVFAGESVKLAYLPLHMERTLSLPAGVAGAVIGVQPLVEICLMPLAVPLAARLGTLRLLAGIAALGIGANLLFALSPGAAGLFAGQVLMGGVAGFFVVLGLVVAQRLLPQAVATASAVFLSSVAISSALGGLAGGIGAQLLGLPLVFLIPAGFSLLAMIGLLVLGRRLDADAPVPVPV